MSDNVIDRYRFINKINAHYQVVTANLVSKRIRKIEPYLPPSVDKSDLEEATEFGSDAFEMSDNEFIQAIKRGELLKILPEDVDAYEFYGHGHSFTKDPQEHGKKDITKMAPAIVFNCDSKYFILDGQHRIAQAVEDKSAFYMFSIPVPKYMLQYLKKRRPKKWKP